MFTPFEESGIFGVLSSLTGSPCMLYDQEWQTVCSKYALHQKLLMEGSVKYMPSPLSTVLSTSWGARLGAPMILVVHFPRHLRTVASQKR